MGERSDIVKRLEAHQCSCGGECGQQTPAYIREAARQISEAAEALEPFADVDGEGDEDFPDDTPVVISFGRSKHYAVRLGDFRRARAALRKLSEETGNG